MLCPARRTCGASQPRNHGRQHRLSVIQKQLDDLGGADVVAQLLREYRLLDGVVLAGEREGAGPGGFRRAPRDFGALVPEGGRHERPAGASGGQRGPAGASEPTVGFFYTTCEQPQALEEVLRRVRAFYPTEFIYLYSDCGVDFREIGRRYRCHYVQRSFDAAGDGVAKARQALRGAVGMGYNQYGMGYAQWLALWKDAAVASGCDWLVHLEDDVMCHQRHSARHLPPPDVGIAGPVTPDMGFSRPLLDHLTETAPVSVRRPLLAFYNGMGASIVNTKAIREMHARFADVDTALLHSLDFRVIRATDATINALMPLLGYNTAVWRDAYMPGQAPPPRRPVAFVHGEKRKYTAAATHDAVMPVESVAAKTATPFATAHRVLLLVNTYADLSAWEIMTRVAKVLGWPLEACLLLDHRPQTSHRLQNLHAHAAGHAQATRDLADRVVRSQKSLNVVFMSDPWGASLNVVARAVRAHNATNPRAPILPVFPLLYATPAEATLELVDSQWVWNHLLEYGMMLRGRPVAAPPSGQASVVRAGDIDALGQRGLGMYGLSASDKAELHSAVVPCVKRLLSLDRVSAVEAVPRLQVCRVWSRCQSNEKPDS